MTGPSPSSGAFRRAEVVADEVDGTSLRRYFPSCDCSAEDGGEGSPFLQGEGGQRQWDEVREGCALAAEGSTGDDAVVDVGDPGDGRRRLLEDDDEVALRVPVYLGLLEAQERQAAAAGSPEHGRA
eukprot:CAMPEP_0118907348 /NCGR_PEP_ID=MMETSP1166-20130328/10839_1 /TAXON_ID=1104430 /ORGANISM="Chrysoreinhardia sp, Strain CCMP3193" /LENGTH=125 /DNA_ID=CAMNT_0006846713 /DNA_START=306 /DNA_END=679 /DNA_ORIENTATION=+